VAHLPPQVFINFGLAPSPSRTNRSPARFSSNSLGSHLITLSQNAIGSVASRRKTSSTVTRRKRASSHRTAAIASCIASRHGSGPRRGFVSFGGILLRTTDTWLST